MEHFRTVFKKFYRFNNDIIKIQRVALFQCLLILPVDYGRHGLTVVPGGFHFEFTHIHQFILCR